MQKLQYYSQLLDVRPPTCLQDNASCSNRYPDNRLAVTTQRTPDARSAQSNIVIVRFRSYAPTLRCRCVVTTRLQPFGKGNDFSPTPHCQRTLLEYGSMYYYSITRCVDISNLSLRGATDFVATWQSRGSANAARVLSGEIPTARPNVDE